MLKGSDEQCVASRWEISRISVGGGCQAAGRTGGKEGRGGGVVRGGSLSVLRLVLCTWNGKERGEEREGHGKGVRPWGGEGRSGEAWLQCAISVKFCVAKRCI